MSPRVRFGGALLLALLTGVVYAQENTAEAPSELAAEKVKYPERPPVLLTVRLKLEGKTDLKPADITFAPFPSGKRCAFMYAGATSGRTIEAMSKLGFKTTLYCSPAASTESVQDLESAGADVGVNVWGAKGTYASQIGANSIQEAFDAVATSRMVIKKKSDAPVYVGAIGGHYSPDKWPIDRNPDAGGGFGYAYHDCNYLILADNKSYMIYLGREREKLLTLRENNDNRIQSQAVPSETIYYQILANQFRGTLKRVEKGQIVRFSLRDFKTPDLAEVESVLGQFGKHELIWHASEAMIGANEYARNKVKIQDVKAAGDAVEVTLALDRDAFPPFLLTPLPLQLPSAAKVKSATAGGIDCPVGAGDDGPVVDVPLRAILTTPCQMTMEASAPDMTIPDEMPITLTVKNNSDKPITGAKLEWVGNIGLTIAGPAEPFDLPAKGEKKIQAAAKTAKGARFGIMPFQAVLTADGRTCMEGFELVAAPRLRVEMDPMQRIGLAKGRSQHFFVHIDNLRSSKPGGPPDKFISHKAGPCKGAVSLDLPVGMTAEPAEQPFELGENQTKTLIFKVRNDAWGDELVCIRPLVKFADESQAVCTLFPGTTVIRRQSVLDFKPLDEKGLLVYASWDQDKTKGADYDKACGSTATNSSGSPVTPNNEGVKGWCLAAQTGCLADSFKNIDYQAGTICLWLRKDPQVRNENTFVPDPAKTALVDSSQWNSSGECIFGMNSFPQIVDSSKGGITLRRYRTWEGKGGYLQATYHGMGRQIRFVQTPFEWTEEWRHVAVLWDINAKRLEIYLDGKLAAKAEPGKDDWYGVPWDRGGPSGEIFSPISCDHGKWVGTCRDELYIYNRALTAQEVAANRLLAERKQ